ncbi:hypothetical protein BS47DRAFT_1368727 [Hydnum rufescens UP504]|uniref:Uncharacterized protein n=1 Tax=Hydnum rufescens UP504 TaxID=1448309 RepID=A0A9P6DJ35_9AGAM|nr:hypothetical protein BS47DRAFT_1368727 [Hydnum rufescens UP504]
MTTNPPNEGHKHDLPRNNRQTKPRNGDAQRKAQGPQMNHIPASAGNADGTTHPPKQVPSLHENPPDKHPDEPTVCAATQARNSRPPNTTINDIAYHTPAAAGTLSQHENPHTKKGCAQPPATRNPIQEPATTVQKTSNTHPLWWVCVCDLDPTPATPPNEHGRMTTRLPNESHERQQVETTMQTPDEPHTRRSILLNPHPPTKAMTPSTENMWPQVRGNPNSEA